MEAGAEGCERVTTSSSRGLALVLALAFSLVLGLIAWPSLAQALPGDELRPIHGVAYQPAPSDYRICTDGSCPYFDTDFFNGDFQQLWGAANGGRDDLGRMATVLGANLIRLYNWNPDRNHLGFLNYAHRNGLRVAVPISNYFVQFDPNAAANIERIVRQVYVDEQGNPSTTPHPAVPTWTVGNEFDIPPGNDTTARRAAAAQVARATAHLVAAENKIGAAVRLPVSAPVSFATFDGQPPAISATRMAIDALRAEPGLPNDFVATRYAAAVNTFNPGPFLRSWLDQFRTLVPDTAVWFSELGIDLGGSCNEFPSPCSTSEQQQAAYIAAQWHEAPPGTAGVHLGGAAFEFVNEPWKKGSEATFGLTKFASSGSFRTVPTARGTYRVDELVDKPSWGALRDAFHSQVLVGAAGGSVAGQALRPNDIALLDRDSGEASLVLDGAAVGLDGNAIDAFTYDRRDGTLLITLARAQRVPGVGRVGTNDVVAYAPDPPLDRLRHPRRARAGRFELVLRGPRVGLRGRARDINALALTRAGRLVISTKGAWRRGKLMVRPHDLLILAPRKKRRAGVHRWRPFMRGRAAGLSRSGEGVDSAWIDARTRVIHLSTVGRFKSGGVRGAAEDIVVCARSRRSGGCSMRLGWRAGLGGLQSVNLTGFAPVPR